MKHLLVSLFALGSVSAHAQLVDGGLHTEEKEIYVDRKGWGNTSCGTSQPTLELRIANCAAVIGAEAT